jgi:hypothetical protein
VEDAYLATSIMRNLFAITFLDITKLKLSIRQNSQQQAFFS